MQGAQPALEWEKAILARGTGRVEVRAPFFWVC